ncbi:MULTISPECIES: superoxide dismutase [Ni] [Parachlamydia]|jgi:nickel superoxide dismutase|uniref:Uncharacterized protein n=2 Tax=Parachlamydia acanthamoebae TaxID=83552 RepID=F8KY36_PARAV|nr:superoxide dismutase [Ni] [Parachlamydia acanthamoebae]EFB40890.1 hypothetical protein pah_c180o085 [Parachlamydia acanthamoebae str. Hall's coccus]CCB85783.1 putative uncharacterized protein [Parachlamydia acanthamoebae UV-7]
MIKKHLLASGIFALLAWGSPLYSHCQMPCGIYHDNMIYDQIDQYVETMVKGITVLTDNKFTTLHDKNEFVRWIMTKETESNKVSELITTYFLQQKIKPDEEDSTKKVVMAHRLLFLIVGIKQNIDIKMVKNFQDQWEKFKLLFHVEGYECKMEQLKLKEWEEARERAKKQDATDHDHAHDHDHDHAHAHHHHH